MRVRPLPHFNHDSLGKTTSCPRAGYKYVMYNTREKACTKIVSEHMPDDLMQARGFFELLVAKSKNPETARIADRLIIALPIELSAEQHWQLIRSFMQKIGKGRIPYIAAFHDKEKDQHNPHCHILFRDCDIETGRKVLGTTTSLKDVKQAQERGWAVPPRTTTKDLRIIWCNGVNAELKRLGLDVRFDQRRLAEQGIDRKPGKHMSPQAYKMAKANGELDRANGGPDNEPKPAKQNGAAYAPPLSASLEESKQRAELRRQHDAACKAMRHEQILDRAALRAAHDEEKLEHARWGRMLYAPARAKAYAETGRAFEKRWRQVRIIKDRDLREDAAGKLQTEQKKDYEARAAERVEKLRPRKNAAWLELKGTQETERQTLKKAHGKEYGTLTRQHIAERYALSERWSQTHLEKTADRVSAKFESSQSMPIVQAHAVRMIKLRNTQDGGAYTGSDEAIQYFTALAHAQAEQLHAQRATLTEQRQGNEHRAAHKAERNRADPLPAAQNRASKQQGYEAKQHQRPTGAQHARRRNARGANAPPSADRGSTPSNATNDASKKRSDGKPRSTDLFDQYRAQYKNKDSGRDGGRTGR